MIDNIASDPLCVYPITADKKNFACTKIRCIHDRNIVSTDFYDFSWPNAKATTTSGYPDALLIAKKSAKVSFNMAAKATGKTKVFLTSTGDVSIKIYAGAMSNLTVALSACASIFALSLF